MRDLTEGEVTEIHDQPRKRKRANGADTFDPRFRLEPFNAITLSTAPNYLVKGILPRVGLVVFWGPPKCGKSFWAFDLVMHVALGREYRGRRVHQGPVVYLALEGGHGFRNRVEAWRRHLIDRSFKVGDEVQVEIDGALVFPHPVRIRRVSQHRGQEWFTVEGSDSAVLKENLRRVQTPVPFYLLDVPVDLVADRDKLVAALRAQLGQQIPAVVVVDTLNRALIGDENKSDDMAKFIRATDLIREAFGCVVIIIHHCGVAGSRPRGHTSLSGADDAQIAIERDDDGIITAKVEHVKDSEAGAVIVSRLERVELGADDEGDPIASCVIVPAQAKPKMPKLPDGAKLAYEQLLEVMADNGERPQASNHIPQGPDIRVCLVSLWREYFYRSYPGKPDTKQKAFVRATLTLQELHLIGIWNDKVWIAGHAGH
jgi:AAA domain